ncbi:MAG: RNA 2',3'-cyclic phosphodiesterase [Nitrospirae bacterium]|nr:RNA 2',3'-cyclic phosphodiesterase [Nitrospirota bacterium]NTW65796.1 RNA 2',3'-cyclic phosphodiesterase [Nitrospirota bacterium]
MRLFIAIELPDEIKQGIAGIQEQLRKAGAIAGWTRPEGIHLTLKFLGEVPEAKAQEIMQALDAAVKGTGKLSLTVEGTGMFPNVKNPHVLWIGVGGDIERLAGLQASIEDAMDKVGFEREERKFSPHLTLARIKFPKPRDNWQQKIVGMKDVKLGGFEAGHVSLMKSELKREGAVYTEVGRADLH